MTNRPEDVPAQDSGEDFDDEVGEETTPDHDLDVDSFEEEEVDG